jgi:hypothetical protein
MAAATEAADAAALADEEDAASKLISGEIRCCFFCVMCVCVFFVFIFFIVLFYFAFVLFLFDFAKAHAYIRPPHKYSRAATRTLTHKNTAFT